MAKSHYQYPADVPFREAARIALMGAFEKMAANAEPTRDGLTRRDPTDADIEALHDMRVGTRRLRAALSVFGKVFPKDDLRELDREVGKITDALGAVRDLDVQIDELRRLQAKLTAAQAYGVGRLIERRADRRDAERKRLLAALDKLERRKFGERFRAALEDALPGSTGGKSGEEAA